MGGLVHPVEVPPVGEAANLASLLLSHGPFEFKEVGVSYSGVIATASEVGVVPLLAFWAHNTDACAAVGAQPVGDSAIANQERLAAEALLGGRTTSSRLTRSPR